VVHDEKRKPRKAPSPDAAEDSPLPVADDSDDNLSIEGIGYL